MFIDKQGFKPFENKVWLAIPTMHDGKELSYIKTVFDKKYKYMILS